MIYSLYSTVKYDLGLTGKVLKGCFILIDDLFADLGATKKTNQLEFEDGSLIGSPNRSLDGLK